MPRSNGTRVPSAGIPRPGSSPAASGPALASPMPPVARAASQDPVARLNEKVRSLTMAGKLSFLPNIDHFTEESSAMVRLYALMLRNPVVKQSLQHKVHSVAALDLLVVAAAETPRDHEIADGCRYAVADAVEGGFPIMAEELLFPALIWKSVVAEKVWYQDLWQRGKFAGKRFYRAVKAKEHAEPQYDEFRNIVGIRATGYGQAEIFDPQDFMVLKNWPLFGGPGMSDLRAAYGYLYQLDMIEKLHLIHMDRYISPVVSATYDERYDHQTQGAALDASLEALRGGQSWIRVPASVKVEALQLAVRGEAEFLEKCKDIREQITLSITGAYLQMLTATSGGDIRGNSRVQASTSELLVWELAARLAAVLNSQFIPGFVRENYAGADYPKVVLGGISYKELLDAIQIDEKAQRMGAKLSARATARKYSLQLAADPSDVMEPLQLPPQPGAAAGGGGDGLGGFDDPEEPRRFPRGPAPAKPAAGRGDKATRARRFAGRVNALLGGREFGDAPADPPPGPAPLAERVALAGRDGAQAVRLLAMAQQQGARVLAGLARRAVVRLVRGAVASPAGTAPPALFTPHERRRLAATFAATIGTAQLLGQARVRRRADQAAKHADPARRFSDVETDLQCFDETGLGGLQPLAPRAAVDYFRAKVPALEVDAAAFEAETGRQAFTLAVSTDETLTGRIHELIARRLETGSALPLVGDTPAGPVPFVAHPKAPPDAATVLIDPAKLDAAWQGDEGYYIPPGGGGAEVAGRRAAFERFLATGRSVEAPIIDLAADGAVSIGDGRHRFAVLRDAGIDQVAVMVPADQAGRVRRRFGSELPAKPGPDTPAQIEELLDQAGVTPRNPQYSDMVYRTNAMDAYNGGAWREMQAVADVFPVWQYHNPDDARSRPSHAARNGKYYASSRNFLDVRGRAPEDACNDRCTFTPVDRIEWSELRAAGERTEEE